MRFNILWLLMIVLFSTVAVATDYTPNSETNCVNGICTLTQYSFPKFVQEDGKWKDYTEARSLKDKEGWGIKYLETDEKFKINIIDYNYTSIQVELETTEKDIDVPVRLWKVNDSVTKYDYKLKSEKIKDETLLLKDKEKKLNTYDFGPDTILEYGYNSTTITLETANVDILDDTYVNGFSGSSTYGTQQTMQTSAGNQEWALVRINLTQLPKGINAEIIKADLILFDDGDPDRITHTFKNCDDIPWDEHTVTYNNFGSPATVCTTNSSTSQPTDNGLFHTFNITTQVNARKEYNNLSFTFYETTSNNIDYGTKEQTNVSYRPKVNITYTIGTYSKNTLITQVSPYNATTELAGICNATSANDTIQYNWKIYNYTSVLDNGTTSIAYTQGVNANVHNWTGYRGDKYTFECQPFYSAGTGTTLNSSELYLYNYTTITLVARNVATNEHLNNVNFSITQPNGTTILRNTGEGYNINITTLPGNHSVNITAELYDGLNATFNLSNDNPGQTFYFGLSFNATLLLYNEMTLELFNISSPNSVDLYLFCDAQTIIQHINNSNSSFNIPCDYNTLRVVVNYPTESYFRTITTNPSDTKTVPVYLIDLDTHTAVFISYFIDDLFNQYFAPLVTINKVVETGTIEIHSDYVDVRNKVGVFLVENGQYEIVLSEGGLPTTNLGKYDADAAGDVTIRVYSINISTTGDSFRSTARYTTGVFNRTIGDDSYVYAYAQFNDTGDDTSQVTWTLWYGSIGGTLLTNLTTTGSEAAVSRFEYNVTGYLDNSLYSVITFTNSQLSTHTVENIIYASQKIVLTIFTYFTPTAVAWFFMIILSLIAISGTLTSAKYTALVLALFAGVFTMFGWFAASIPIIGLVGLFALISILKGGETSDPND